jgi:K+-transporting ATPase ATPase A chain
MLANDWLFLGILALALGISAPLLGAYMARVFDGRRHPMSFLLPLERGFYRLAGIDPNEEMDWRRYCQSLLAFSLLGLAFLFLLLVFQGILPLNPARLNGMKWDLALNTAVSFVTNTNWQSYSGESSLSYLSQAVGLTVQNFLSAATGLGVCLALIRGLRARREPLSGKRPGLGNFYVDVNRAVIYVLLPISLIFAVALASQGVIQNVNHYESFTTFSGKADVLPGGMAASQAAIKQLGSNGGGFFGANSAHPFENPNRATNFIELYLILLIPMALPFAFGRMTGKRREGYALFSAMLFLCAVGIAAGIWSELNFGTMEGKETRFGPALSALWGAVTTSTSNGSVNAAMDSQSPLLGLVAMVNIMLGEVAFGGVGSGLYGLIAFAVATVFIAGLMVGRSPEYFGKKIEAREIKLSMAAIIFPALAIIMGTAAALLLPAGRAGILNHGPHALSEILYACSSAAGNNGSGFAGLTANTVFYNLLLSFLMLVGRFGVIIPMLALAGYLVDKKPIAPSAGTFPTDSSIFVALLVFVILIVGGLTFFPALALGPILEHLLLGAGLVF